MQELVLRNRNLLCCFIAGTDVFEAVIFGAGANNNASISSAAKTFAPKKLIKTAIYTKNFLIFPNQTG